MGRHRPDVGDGQIVEHVPSVPAHIALDLIALLLPEPICHYLTARLRLALAPGLLDHEENPLHLLGELLQLEAGVVRLDGRQAHVDGARRLHGPGVALREQLAGNALGRRPGVVHPILLVDVPG